MLNSTVSLNQSKSFRESFTDFFFRYDLYQGTVARKGSCFAGISAGALVGGAVGSVACYSGRTIQASEKVITENEVLIAGIAGAAAGIGLTAGMIWGLHVSLKPLAARSVELLMAQVKREFNQYQRKYYFLNNQIREFEKDVCSLKSKLDKEKTILKTADWIVFSKRKGEFGKKFNVMNEKLVDFLYVKMNKSQNKDVVRAYDKFVREGTNSYWSRQAFVERLGNHLTENQINDFRYILESGPVMAIACRSIGPVESEFKAVEAQLYSAHSGLRDNKKTIEIIENVYGVECGRCCDGAILPPKSKFVEYMPV